MRENFTYGSVRGAAGDGSPYRDSTTLRKFKTYASGFQIKVWCR